MTAHPITVGHGLVGTSAQACHPQSTDSLMERGRPRWWGSYDTLKALMPLVSFLLLLFPVFHYNCNLHCHFPDGLDLGLQIPVLVNGSTAAAIMLHHESVHTWLVRAG